MCLGAYALIMPYASQVFMSLQNTKQTELGHTLSNFQQGGRIKVLNHTVRLHKTFLVSVFVFPVLLTPLTKTSDSVLGQHILLIHFVKEADL